MERGVLVVSAGASAGGRRIAPFPEELPHRCVKLFSYAGGYGAGPVYGFGDDAGGGRAAQPRRRGH